MTQTPKADAWTIQKYIPDAEDFIALAKAFDEYTNAPALNFENEADEIAFAFSCGFYRACAWMKHRESMYVCDGPGCSVAKAELIDFPFVEYGNRKVYYFHSADCAYKWNEARNAKD